MTLPLACSRVLLVGATLLPLNVQAQTPTFRSGTRLIVETAAVTSKDGTPIEGLTADDFVVSEDGVPQMLAFVEFQRLDGTRGPLPLPDRTTGARRGDRTGGSRIASADAPGELRYRDRRLLVLYFDLSALSPPDQARAYTSAELYVDTQMAPADVIAVMTFQSGAVRVGQDFTDDKARVKDALRIAMFGDDQDGDGIADRVPEGTAFGQNDGEFNLFNTDRQLAALQTAADLLRALPERKALVYFSSGLRLNGTDNHAQLRATINAAVRANVSLHPIDARGLVASAPPGDAARPSRSGIGTFTGALAAQEAAQSQRSQDTLYALAKDTGGTVLFDYNDLSRGIVQAAATLKSHYVLGYYASNTVKDGRHRRVTVTLRTRRSDVDIQHRAGYFAEKEFGRMSAAEKERQLEDALRLGNPITDMRLAIEVNFFQLTRAEYFVPVSVKIPGSELALARRRGAARTVIDILGEVKDSYGTTIQNVRDRIDLKLTGDVAGQAHGGAIQYETGFTLLPDRYTIKLLARDAITGRIGTFQTDFTVPNLNREEMRVPLSSVVLSAQLEPSAKAAYSVRQKIDGSIAHPLIQDGGKLVPSVTRVFRADSDLYVFLEAYQRDAIEMRPLVGIVGFYRDEIKVMESAPLMVTDGWNPTSKAVPLRFSVPLQELPPGQYDCQVTVLDPVGRRAAFWRAPISIWR